MKKKLDPSICYCLRATPFGEVAIVWAAEREGPEIRRVLLPSARVAAPRLVAEAFHECVRSSCARIDAVADRIEAAMRGAAVRFSLDAVRLDLCTEFQRSVLCALHEIPRGRVTTYGGIARRLGLENASRAVGTAHATNPFPILIACHRTIRSDRTLGGFGGGVAMKRALLEAEGVAFEADGKVAAGSIV